MKDPIPRLARRKFFEPIGELIQLAPRGIQKILADNQSWKDEL
jgi:hypothetical protein